MVGALAPEGRRRGPMAGVRQRRVDNRGVSERSPSSSSRREAEGQTRAPTPALRTAVQPIQGQYARMTTLSSGRRLLRGSVCLVVCLLPGVVLPRGSNAGGQTPAGVTSALSVLEAALTSAPPRLQELSFATLSRYHCSGARPGDACERLVARCASHSGWEVRLMNVPNAFRPRLPRGVRRRVIEQAIRDASPHVVRAVSKLLAEHPEAWEKKMLVDLSQSRDGVVRQHAAAALIRLGETRYAEVLEKALTSDDGDAALEAARHTLALGTKEQQRARRVLRRMLDDHDEVTRANAI